MESKGAASRRAGDAGDRSCRKWRFRIHGCAFHLTALDPDVPHFVGSLHRQTVDPGSAHHGSCSLPPARPVKTWISRSLPNVINMTGGVTLSGRSHRNWRRPLRLRQRWDHDGVSKHRQPGTLPVVCMACSPLCVHSQTDRNVVVHKAQRITKYSRTKCPRGNDVVGIRGPECFPPSNRASHIRGL